MLGKQVLISLSVLTLSLSAYGGKAEDSKKGASATEKVKPSPITIEVCCEEYYGDTEECHKLSHVTAKSKMVKGKSVKKQCFEDDEYDYSIGE